MFSPEHLNSLVKDLMIKLNNQNGDTDKKGPERCDYETQAQNRGNNKGDDNSTNVCSTPNGSSVQGGDTRHGSTVQNGGNKSKLQITPSQALVIAGILGGTLDVYSVLMDRNQGVEIVLVGSLKKEVQKPKTELEMMMDKIGSMPFDQVMKTMLERLT